MQANPSLCNWHVVWRRQPRLKWRQTACFASCLNNRTPHDASLLFSCVQNLWFWIIPAHHDPRLQTILSDKTSFDVWKHCFWVSQLSNDEKRKRLHNTTLVPWNLVPNGDFLCNSWSRGLVSCETATTDIWDLGSVPKTDDRFFCLFFFFFGIFGIFQISQFHQPWKSHSGFDQPVPMQTSHSQISRNTGTNNQHILSTVLVRPKPMAFAFLFVQIILHCRDRKSFWVLLCFVFEPSQLELHRDHCTGGSRFIWASLNRVWTLSEVI